MKEEKTSEVKHSEVAQAPKKDTAKMVWMIVAIVAIIALIGSIAYGYMSMKNLNKKISDQQAQINDLENTKKTLQDTASAAATAATNAAAKAVGNAISGLSDNDTITSAASAYAQAINSNVKSAQVKIVKTSNGFSWVQITPSGATAYNALLKKQGSNWIVIYEGTSAPTGQMLQQFGAPTDIAN